MSSQTTQLSSPTQRRVVGLVSLVQGLLIFVPTIVLGQAIGWPATLGDPASIALPRLLEQAPAVRFGYFAYLAMSVLFFVTVFLVSRLTLTRLASSLLPVVVGFAIASTVFRSIGIIRWFSPMPQLAQSWEAATTDEERNVISVTFDAINNYGGTIGEVLGVSLFAAIAVFLLCLGALRERSMPIWLAVFGFLSAVALLASLSDLFGIEPAFLVVFLGTTFIQLWFVAAGLWLVFSPGKRRDKSVA
jgi:hypothetical protein